MSFPILLAFIKNKSKLCFSAEAQTFDEEWQKEIMKFKPSRTRCNLEAPKYRSIHHIPKEDGLRRYKSFPTRIRKYYQQNEKPILKQSVNEQAMLTGSLRRNSMFYFSFSHDATINSVRQYFVN